MKNIALLFIAFLLFQPTMLAQQGWFWQSPLPTGYTLHSIDFVNATTGWAVGGMGTIVNTTDGGITWSTQISGTTERLFSVSFADANNGTAVGGVWNNPKNNKQWYNLDTTIKRNDRPVVRC